MIDNKYIKINLIDDLSKICKDDINEMGYDTSSLSLDVVLIQYNELLMRLITPQKRQIEISREFCCPPSLQAGFNLLKSKVSDGLSINAHLSRKIKSLEYDDKMLYDWNVHHLHLGTETDSNTGLIRGTKEVAFAVVTDDTVYFIQVFDHNQWSNKDVLNIIESNWPDLLSRYEIEGEPETEFTAANIQDLRTANINTILKLDSGKSYISCGDGYTAQGSSIRATEGTIELKKYMEAWESDILRYLQEKGKLSKTICEMRRTDSETLTVFDENDIMLVQIPWKKLTSIYDTI